MDRSSTAAPATLPIVTTSFVDRRVERQRTRALLGQTRLVTLTGTGGVGKTRLAIEVAREVFRIFDDVWFVDLGPIASSGSVPEAVASGIGFQSLGTDFVADLADYLRHREALLILDGCEHVLTDAAELVVALLRSCPGLRVIATSRAPLRLAHETVMRLGTLSTDPRSERLRPPAVSAAVQLFLDRSAHVHDAIDIRDDLEVIAEICRRLDGLPLAIELAAARVTALSPRQILDRLTESFRILSGRNRDVPDRLQSIRLAIGWSYALCSPDEQRVWQEMSVFVGGWDLSAAEWINGERPAAMTMLDIVQSLLEKSILARRQAVDTTWYSMLFAIRQFGLEQLTESGSLQKAQERHRDWYRHRLHQAEREWIGPDQPYWLALLRRELPNIRSALVYSVQTQDGEAVLDLTVTAWRICWQPDARIDELRRWLLRGLALPGNERSTLRAQALGLLAMIECFQGDGEKAEGHLERARRLEQELGDPYTTSFVDTAEAELATDPARAVELYKAAIGDPAGVPEVVARANPSARLSQYLDRIGRTEDARIIRERILEISSQRGERYEASGLLMHAGALAAQRGDIEGALDTSTASLRLAHPLGNPMGVADTEEIIAGVANQQGDYVRAATLLGVAAGVREREATQKSSFPPLVSDVDSVTTTAQRMLGADRFARAFQRGRALSRDEGIALALDDPSVVHPVTTVSPGGSPSSLTRREREVAALVARGLSDREIASEIVVSRRTAEGHVQRILVKLGLTSRTQLAALYLNTYGGAETVPPR